MGRTLQKQHKEAAAQARKAKAQKRAGNDIQFNPGPADPEEIIGNARTTNPSPIASQDPVLPSDNDEVCHWNGGISHIPSDSDSDSEFSWATDSDTEDEFSELEGDRLVESLQKQLEMEIEMLHQPTAYKMITKSCTAKEWTQAETKRGLGYNGLSVRTKCRNGQQAREREKGDSIARKRYAPLRGLLLI
jgi:hypothetical protein